MLAYKRLSTEFMKLFSASADSITSNATFLLPNAQLGSMRLFVYHRSLVMTKVMDPRWPNTMKDFAKTVPAENKDKLWHVQILLLAEWLYLAQVEAAIKSELLNLNKRGKNVGNTRVVALDHWMQLEILSEGNVINLINMDITKPAGGPTRLEDMG